MPQVIALSELSDVEQMLWRAMKSRIDLERAHGVPVRDMYLQPDLYNVYQGIRLRCADRVEAEVGYLFDGVHIHKGSIVQKEPFMIGTPWANGFEDRQKQREELKMATLN